MDDVLRLGLDLNMSDGVRAQFRAAREAREQPVVRKHVVGECVTTSLKGLSPAKDLRIVLRKKKKAAKIVSCIAAKPELWKWALDGDGRVRNASLEPTPATDDVEEGEPEVRLSPALQQLAMSCFTVHPVNLFREKFHCNGCTMRNSFEKEMAMVDACTTQDGMLKVWRKGCFEKSGSALVTQDHLRTKVFSFFTNNKKTNKNNDN